MKSDLGFGPRGRGGVRVDGISKRLGKSVVVAPATFTVEAGRSAAIVGPNGAGKTTILRILAGVLDPDAGTAVIAGGSPRDGNVGLVNAGDRGVYWRLTARRNLEFSARLAGLRGDAIPAAVAACASHFGLDPLLERTAGTYSTGERRRLVIARAFVGRPPVLVMDEPLEDLDNDGRDAVSSAARTWTEGGGTVLFAAPSEADVPPHDDVIRIERPR